MTLTDILHEPKHNLRKIAAGAALTAGGVAIGIAGAAYAMRADTPPTQTSPSPLETTVAATYTPIPTNTPVPTATYTPTPMPPTATPTYAPTVTPTLKFLYQIIDPSNLNNVDINEPIFPVDHSTSIIDIKTDSSSNPNVSTLAVDLVSGTNIIAPFDGSVQYFKKTKENPVTGEGALIYSLRSSNGKSVLEFTLAPGSISYVDVGSSFHRGEIIARYVSGSIGGKQSGQELNIGPTSWASGLPLVLK